MNITTETIKNLNQSDIMELFYNQFKDYGKKCAVYVAKNHNMSETYCADYIASGLFELFINRCEKLHSEIDNSEKSLYFSRETMLRAFFGTKKLIKKIMAMTNYSSYFKNNAKAYNTSFKDTLSVDALSVYCEQIGDAVYSKTNYKLPRYKKSKNKYSEYRNVKKVNSHIIDIIDVLEQKENRSHKVNLSLNAKVNDNGDEYGVFIKSYYPTPEQELLNKLSRFYSRKTSQKIKSDKNFYRLLEVETKITKSITLDNKDKQTIKNLKIRCGVESLNTKELLYIVNNY